MQAIELRQRAATGREPPQSTETHPQSSETHPRPSVAEAIERGKMRRAADDGTQRAIWIAFYVALGIMMVVGVAAGLRHRDAGEALPPPPPALR
jgi:hypothetical protein